MARATGYRLIEVPNIRHVHSKWYEKSAVFQCVEASNKLLLNNFCDIPHRITLFPPVQTTAICDIGVLISQLNVTMNGRMHIIMYI